MTLAEFLAARLGEDEMMAHAVTAAHGMHSGSDLVVATNQPDFDDFRPICDFDPARVLREVEAKRAIVTNLPAYGKQRRDLREHIYLPENAEYHTGHADGTDDAAYYVLRQLAAVWSDHPDYDEAWKP